MILTIGAPDVRLLVTGASGQLGAYFLDALLRAGHQPIAWSGSDPGERSGVRLHPVDLTDVEYVTALLDSLMPDAILHLAAISTAAGVLADAARAEAVNIRATETLARWCAENDRQILYTSTDLVFDGTKPWNREDDPARPVLSYGRTKLAGEQPILAAPGGLVARMPLMYGPSRCGRSGFFDQAISALRRGESRTFFEDEFRTPLDYATASTFLVAMLESETAGLVHVAGEERMSRFELMSRVASGMSIDPSLVRANRRSDSPGPEPRPEDVSLDTSRLMGRLPCWTRPPVEAVVASWN